MILRFSLPSFVLNRYQYTPLGTLVPYSSLPSVSVGDSKGRAARTPVIGLQVGNARPRDGQCLFPLSPNRQGHSAQARDGSAKMGCCLGGVRSFL